MIRSHRLYGLTARRSACPSAVRSKRQSVGRLIFCYTVTIGMTNDPPSIDETTGFDGVEEEEFDRLFGVVADGVIGAAGGLVGTAMMVVVLFVAESMGAFSRESFASVATMVGLEQYGPAVTMGFLVFLLGGMLPWPLLFAALMGYLPGKRPPVTGVVFGTILWTGFIFGFYEGYTGTALALYLALTLVAHWAYGFGVGLVFEYLSTRPESLV